MKEYFQKKLTKIKNLKSRNHLRNGIISGFNLKPMYSIFFQEISMRPFTEKQAGEVAVLQQ